MISIEPILGQKTLTVSTYFQYTGVKINRTDMNNGGTLVTYEQRTGVDRLPRAAVTTGQCVPWRT